MIPHSKNKTHQKVQVNPVSQTPDQQNKQEYFLAQPNMQVSVRKNGSSATKRLSHTQRQKSAHVRDIMKGL